MNQHAYATRATASAASSTSVFAAGVLQRKCACGGHCDECEAKSMQRSGTGRAPESVPHSVHEALRSPAQSLDGETRGFMEKRFGHDFGRVRVHTDARATQSATAVHAAAYTVGEHVVFGSGQYSPKSQAGKELLAHELTHVVQQGSATPSGLEAMRSGSAAARAESEAETTAAQVARNGGARGMAISSTGPGLDRQPAGGAAQPAKQTPLEIMVEDARRAAFIRCQLAHDVIAGIGPPAPVSPEGKPGTDYAGMERQMRARQLASLMFEWPNPNMDQITQIVSTMRDRLSPGIAAVPAAKGDKYCSSLTAYVVDHKPPITLCDSFSKQTSEEQIRTLIHESAHLAGIGGPDGEGYCPIMDCNTVCPGGFDSADAWAQFVTCLTGHEDHPAPIVVKPPTPGNAAKP